ncbi:hypothetical protein PLESTB_001693700 [Pleodorina starrii]|uniref:Uncharacterized protein n=1 Tax=Pleodorina starrii TaxID=330485 RepID=A0A9W6F960_9CHLO|nr:hypothetical protein PLESTB_001693700 [Pleodorina starrii]
MSPISTAPTEIYVFGCCRIEGLLFSADSVLFKTLYVPGVDSSILTQAPAFILIGMSAPGALAYTFVPAVSTRGAALDCAINTALAYTPTGELTASAVPGGCSIGWDTSKYSLGDTVGVGLRVSEPSTGQYNDITFLMMSADLSGAPVVHAVISDDQPLPTNGGTIQVTYGAFAQVVFTIFDPNAGDIITASSTTLPAAPPSAWAPLL